MCSQDELPTDQQITRDDTKTSNETVENQEKLQEARKGDVTSIDHELVTVKDNYVMCAEYQTTNKNDHVTLSLQDMAGNGHVTDIRCRLVSERTGSDRERFGEASRNAKYNEGHLADSFENFTKL